MSAAQVLPLMPPPGRECALNAIARAILRVRSNGWTCEALAGMLDCSAETIERASNEHSLLSFDSIARLMFHFPEVRPVITSLWDMGATAEPTTDERFERIEADLRAIRKEIE